MELELVVYGVKIGGNIGAAFIKMKLNEDERRERHALLRRELSTNSLHLCGKVIIITNEGANNKLLLLSSISGDSKLWKVGRARKRKLKGNVAFAATRKD